MPLAPCTVDTDDPEIPVLAYVLAMLVKYDHLKETSQPHLELEEWIASLPDGNVASLEVAADGGTNFYLDPGLTGEEFRKRCWSSIAAIAGVDIDDRGDETGLSIHDVAVEVEWSEDTIEERCGLLIEERCWLLGRIMDLASGDMNFIIRGGAPVSLETLKTVIRTNPAAVVDPIVLLNTFYGKASRGWFLEQDDWYLPAIHEMIVVATTTEAVGFPDSILADYMFGLSLDTNIYWPQAWGGIRSPCDALLQCQARLLQIVTTLLELDDARAVPGPSGNATCTAKGERVRVTETPSSQTIWSAGFSTLGGDDPEVGARAIQILNHMERTSVRAPSVVDRRAMLLHQIAAQHRAAAWASAIEMVADRSSLAARTKTTAGDLPVHLAAKNKFMVVAVMEAIVRAYPDGVHEPDADGKTPVQLAVDHSSSEALWVLFEARPESMQSVTGLTLELAIRAQLPMSAIEPLLQQAKADREGKCLSAALRCVEEPALAVSIVDALLATNPDVVGALDARGWPLTELTCIAIAPAAVRALLSTRPGVAKDAFKELSVGLSVDLDQLQLDDDAGLQTSAFEANLAMWMFQMWIKQNRQPPPERWIRALYETWPDAIKAKDNAGKTMLELAIERSRTLPSVRWIQAFFNSCSNTADDENGKTALQLVIESSKALPSEEWICAFLAAFPTARSYEVIGMVELAIKRHDRLPSKSWIRAFFEPFRDGGWLDTMYCESSASGESADQRILTPHASAIGRMLKAAIESSDPPDDKWIQALLDSFPDAAKALLGVHKSEFQKKSPGSAVYRYDPSDCLLWYLGKGAACTALLTQKLTALLTQKLIEADPGAAKVPLSVALHSGAPGGAIRAVFAESSSKVKGGFKDQLFPPHKGNKFRLLKDPELARAVLEEWPEVAEIEMQKQADLTLEKIASFASRGVCRGHFSTDYQVCPEGTLRGYTLLWLALERKATPAEVLQAILEANPGAAIKPYYKAETETSKTGYNHDMECDIEVHSTAWTVAHPCKWPLNLALQSSKLDAAKIRTLLNFTPAGSTSGVVPLQFALESKANPLQVCRVIKMLLAWDPSAALAPGPNNELALHIVSARYHTFTPGYTLDLLKSTFDAAPKAIFVKNDTGVTPLHPLAKDASRAADVIRVLTTSEPQSDSGFMYRHLRMCHGGDINAPIATLDGITPLALVIQLGFDECAVKMIQDYGAGSADAAQLAAQSHNPELKQWGLNFGRLFGRYRVVERKHVSPTCAVFFGFDIGEDAANRQDAEDQPVVLKFMEDTAAFRRELDQRTKLALDGNQSRSFCIPVLDQRQAVLPGTFDKFPSIRLADERDLSTPTKLQHMLVLERGSGGDLTDFVSHGNIAGVNVFKVLDMLRSMAEVLEWMADDRGVMHGDVKGRNFVLLASGELAAIDLDAAADINAEELAGVKVTSSGFLPPEQAVIVLWDRQASNRHQGADAGPRPPGVVASAQYDMWAFGVMMYELVTGFSLFDYNVVEDVEDSELALIAQWPDKIKARKLKRINERQWPCKTLLSELLSLDPEGRPASWADVLVQLEIDTQKTEGPGDQLRVIEQLTSLRRALLDDGQQTRRQLADGNKAVLGAVQGEGEDTRRQIARGNDAVRDAVRNEASQTRLHVSREAAKTRAALKCQIAGLGEQLTAEFDAMKSLMLQLREFECPFLFQFIDADTWHDQLKDEATEAAAPELEAATADAEPGNPPVEVAKTARKRFGRLRKVMSGVAEAVTNPKKVIKKVLEGKKKTLLLQILCGVSLEVVVEYTIEVTDSIFEKAEKMVKTSLALTKVGLKVAAVWNAGASGARMLGIPIPKIPKDKLKDAKGYLEGLNSGDADAATNEQRAAAAGENLDAEQMKAFAAYLTELDKNEKSRQDHAGWATKLHRLEDPQCPGRITYVNTAVYTEHAELAKTAKARLAAQDDEEGEGYRNRAAAHELAGDELASGGAGGDDSHGQLNHRSRPNGLYNDGNAVHITADVLEDRLGVVRADVRDSIAAVRSSVAAVEVSMAGKMDALKQMQSQLQSQFNAMMQILVANSGQQQSNHATQKPPSSVDAGPPPPPSQRTSGRTTHIAMFKAAGPEGGYLSSDKAAKLLLQSGLPKRRLSCIWQEAKIGPPYDKMSEAEFLKACVLLEKHGSPVSAARPSPSKSLGPPRTDADDARYVAMFNGATPHDGRLASEKAAKLLLQSGLSKGEVKGVYLAAKVGPPYDTMSRAEFIQACRTLAARGAALQSQ